MRTLKSSTDRRRPHDLCQLIADDANFIRREYNVVPDRHLGGCQWAWRAVGAGARPWQLTTVALNIHGSYPKT